MNATASFGATESVSSLFYKEGMSEDSVFLATTGEGRSEDAFTQHGLLSRSEIDKAYPLQSSPHSSGLLSPPFSILSSGLVIVPRSIARGNRQQYMTNFHDALTSLGYSAVFSFQGKNQEVKNWGERERTLFNTFLFSQEMRQANTWEETLLPWKRCVVVGG